MVIKKVGVIGAGVMGAGIAAQVANAGVPVMLLDIVPPGANDRSVVATSVVAKMLQTEPAPFMTPGAAALVEPGNIEDDLGRLAECDWIIEVIVERPEVKQDLYRKLQAVRRPGTAVSSNTSTIPLHVLTAGLGEQFARDFLITHFFNPPRYMRLLEVVPGPHSDPAIVQAVRDFADATLGKSIVICNDAPGFIANRVGSFWMQVGIVAAFDGGVSVEAADAVIGKPFGIPRTGIFGLLDLVGIDLIPHVNASLARTLAKDDAFHRHNREMTLMTRMIADGFIGRKGKGGFYLFDRKTRTRQAIDLATGDYRAEQTPDLPELKSPVLAQLMDAPSQAGQYAWAVMGATLAYAASVVPEAAATLVDVDAAMRLGYNWRWGPFQLIDKLGTAWFAERLRAERKDVPKLLQVAAGRPFYRIELGREQFLGLDGEYRDILRADGVLPLDDVKRQTKPVMQNSSASVWDIGDGVLCFEFTSKANSLDDAIMALLRDVIAAAPKALVIYNEGPNFSVGANLPGLLAAAKEGKAGAVEAKIITGQHALTALKYAPFPVVAAPVGMALGGGCEVLLHSSAVQAHAEAAIGLVECNVGLVPGWGGCKEMLLRLRDADRVFDLIRSAAITKSAAQAKEWGYLRPTDGISMNRDRVLADAKARALSMVPGYTPPAPPHIPTSPRTTPIAAENHDLIVATALAGILYGADNATEGTMLARERAALDHLIATPGTQARIEHTLATGKPLRN
ncbi:3-hydroxyacyl-CoA dehydrogenase/enoyl-CoA hydratase family protein [Acidisphaera sp. L21]|uniref:3-hydroxyacyl-CoA dehydrogenase/enoyl-CoA hydratase family protein n=1 Tax=Acidisphaera sp. L21 TaxID=1641851 RepID=UPI00131DABD8|nr:3-hydroxyacyl-CoA dehydrogenase/enoyl-CoA hydratase family protein [Acidisphaera sp. L21]